MARVARKLRWGFSTGSAATAAARAALRQLVTGEPSTCIAIRLPTGIFFPVPISETQLTGQNASATVFKDGGDDPDVTHGAAIVVNVRCWSARTDKGPEKDRPGHVPGINLVAGEGIGVATKPGLPVSVGEPAVNPVPRRMLAENVTEELQLWAANKLFTAPQGHLSHLPEKPCVYLPFTRTDGLLERLLVEVEIRVPRGLELARRTLNPRLGIIGGISILGTTGLVKPFSHEAYRETIQAALSVAASSACPGIVLSTGGKSERLARKILQDWPEEAFVQIADFFAFALQTGRSLRFDKMVLSVFFGKALKMAQGHPYTHAHVVPLDLAPLARQAAEAGCARAFCRRLAQANTAREALDLLLANRAGVLIRTVARRVLEQASKICGDGVKVRLLVFGYEGNLLLDSEDL